MSTILVVDDEQMLCDLTLLDLHMPDMSGIVVRKQIRALDPQARVIILTGGATSVWENQARELGVTEFLLKGVLLNILVRALGKAMQSPGQA